LRVQYSVTTRPAQDVHGADVYTALSTESEGGQQEQAANWHMHSPINAHADMPSHVPTWIYIARVQHSLSTSMCMLTRFMKLLPRLVSLSVGVSFFLIPSIEGLWTFLFRYRVSAIG
jgi:hypothetical protein